MGACTKMCSSLLLLLGFSRYKEARADAFASEHTQSIEELKAAEQFFQNLVPHQLEQLKELEGFNQMPLWKQNLYSRVTTVNLLHPHPLKQAERIRAVIEKRQKQQS